MRGALWYREVYFLLEAKLFLRICAGDDSDHDMLMRLGVSSVSRPWNQSICLLTIAEAMIADSIVDCATRVCFDFHRTKMPCTYRRYPVVDLSVYISPTRSAGFLRCCESECNELTSTV
jgi:hypothetical protein